MTQNKKRIKLTIILLLTTILISHFFLISLAKTEVYFSLYDILQILSTTSPKSEVQTININTASQDELIKILQISEPLAQKVIALREELGGFKDLQTLTQLPEITNIDCKEWEK